MDKTFVLPGGQLSPVFAKSGSPSDLTLINLSATETIYLSDHFSNAPGTGTPLGPGNVGSWAARKPLYASPGAAVAASLAVSDSLGTLFPAGAVASQLIAQGLTPVAIGNQIALQGAPPINVFQNVFSANTAALPAAMIPTTGMLDVHTYQSLNITLCLYNPIGVAGASRWFLQWFDDNNNFLSQEVIDASVWIAPPPSIVSPLNFQGTYINIPVRGHYFQIIGSAPGSAGYGLYWTVTGTYKVVPCLQVAEPTFPVTVGGPPTGATDGNFNAGWATWTSIAKAGATQALNMPWRNGPMTCQIRANNVTAAALEIVLQPSNGGNNLAEAIFPISAGTIQVANLSWIQGNQPLRVLITPAAALATSIFIALGMTPQ